MRSKLSRQNEIGEQIGRELQTIYDEVLRQPPPDRFCKLLDRLERQKTPARAYSESAPKRALPTADANSTPLETARPLSDKRIRRLEPA